MILRLWFRVLGIALLLLVMWVSAWAGFQNLNPASPFSHNDWARALVGVIASYGLLLVSAWLIRGGPDQVRKAR